MDGTYRFNYEHERAHITTFTYDEHGKLLGVIAPSGEILTIREYNKYRAEQQRQSEAEPRETTEESADETTEEKEE